METKNIAFEMPKMEVILFENEDVIVTSTYSLLGEDDSDEQYGK